MTALQRQTSLGSLYRTGMFAWYSIETLKMIRNSIFLCLLIIFSSHGQTSQGNIVGLVTDPASAVIVKVKITARNPATGFVYIATTNDEGIYRIPYVNPGAYEITYEASGFKKLVRSGVTVRSTETVRADAALEVGGLVESVRVTSEAPLLEVETSSSGHLLTGQAINSLPNPQMNLYSLPWLFPGITSQGGWGHGAGGRVRAFNVTMDGVPSTEPVRGALDSGNRAITPTQELLDEVKIVTTVLPAEYGHSGGGIMNVNYKSGTNQLHGLAKERYMSKSMLHRLWQDPMVAPGTKLGYHMMTAWIGGPIVIPKLYDGRNRTFFVAGWQRHHEHVSEISTVNTPSPAMLAGDFNFGGQGYPIYDPESLVRLPGGSYSRTQFPGNMIPKSRFDPAVQKFLSFNPWQGESNLFGSTFINKSGPQSNYAAPTHAAYYLTSMDEKIDHSFSDNHKMFGRYSNYRRRGPGNGRWQVVVSNPIFDYNATSVPSNQQQLALSDSLVISPVTINQVRLGTNRRKYTRLPASLNQDWAGQIGIPNVGPETMPNFSGLYSNFPQGATVEVTENISLQENLTMVRGRHTFKTGYELFRTRANALISTQPSGVYTFGGTEFPFTPNTGNTFASFLLGGVNNAQFTKATATWLPRWWDHALYFQDDWKVTRNVTFNLGLRWQYESPFNTKYGQQSQFSPEVIDSLTGLRGALLHPTEPLATRDWNNFQPRIGAAYNFRKNWVFRGGFAINTLDLWTNGLSENFDEYLATTSIQQVPGNPDVAFYLSKGPPSPVTFNILPNGTSPFVGTNYSARNISYYDPHMRMPYMMNWNAGFQHQLSDTMLVELSYQGSAGVGLLQGWDINAIPLNIASTFDELNKIRIAAQNYKPYPQFGSIRHYSNYGHSTYHSATIRFEKRYSKGLYFSSFYTRSKAIDEASTDGAASGATFYNRALEKGRSAFDVTNRWVTYVNWNVPAGKGQRWLGNSNRVVNGMLGNWMLSVIQTLENGLPMTFSFAGASNVFLPGALRPDMAAGKTYSDIRVPWDRRGPCRFNAACALPWADINAFTYPASFSVGQSGRSILTGPSMVWHQLALSKEFRILERLKARLRYDINNPFKYYFFLPPNSVVNFSTPQNFGKISGNQGSFSGIGGRLYQNIAVELEF